VDAPELIVGLCGCYRPVPPSKIFEDPPVMESYMLRVAELWPVAVGSDTRCSAVRFRLRKPIRRFKTRSDITSMGISPDDQFLTTLDSDGWVTRWNLETGVAAPQWQGPSNGIIR
jgi:hypothetical protein